MISFQTILFGLFVLFIFYSFIAISILNVYDAIIYELVYQKLRKYFN